MTMDFQPSESIKREQTLGDAMRQVAAMLASSGFPKVCSFDPGGMGYMAIFRFDTDNDIKAAEKIRSEVERLLGEILARSGVIDSDVKRVKVHFERKE